MRDVKRNYEHCIDAAVGLLLTSSSPRISPCLISPCLISLISHHRLLNHISLYHLSYLTSSYIKNNSRATTLLILPQCAVVCTVGDLEWQINIQSAEHDATSSQLTDQLREAQASNDLYEHHVSELEAELFSMKRTKEEVTKTMLELQDHNNYLQFKDQEQDENIQQQEEKILLLEQQLETQTRRDIETIRNLQSALRTAEEALQAAEVSIEAAGAESLAREQQLQQSLEAIERREDQSAATEVIVGELRLCLQKSIDEKHTLELAHTDVVAELSALKVSHGELQTQLSSSQTELSALQRSHLELQTELSALQRSHLELQTELSALKRSHLELQTELSALQRSLQELQTELSASEDRYNTLAVSGQTDNQHLQLQITESNRQKDALKQQLVTLEQHRDMLQHEMVEAAALARRDGLLIEDYRRQVIPLSYYPPPLL